MYYALISKMPTRFTVTFKKLVICEDSRYDDSLSKIKKNAECGTHFLTPVILWHQSYADPVKSAS